MQFQRNGKGGKGKGGKGKGGNGKGKGNRNANVAVIDNDPFHDINQGHATSRIKVDSF